MHCVSHSPTVCGHSCFLQGLGTHLVKSYVDHVRNTQSGVEKVMLLSKEYLIPFYERSGFVDVGKSSVCHGDDPSLITVLYFK